MCGRYNILTSAQAIVDFFEVAELLFNPDDWHPRCNVAPSQQVPVVRRRTAPGRELALLRWGLLPHWAKEEKTRHSMINARAESVASKPAYRSAFRSRRCLIPATGFFEWQQTPAGKQPWNFRLKSGQPLAFAGLWEHWEGDTNKVVESFTIIVTEANELVRPVHDRMPVILAPDEYNAWLDPAQHDREALQAMLDPYPAAEMEGYPVSRAEGIDLAPSPLPTGAPQGIRACRHLLLLSKTITTFPTCGWKSAMTNGASNASIEAPTAAINRLIIVQSEIPA